MLKLDELELEIEVSEERLLELELDELDELELDDKVEEDSVDEDTGGEVTGGVTMDETESVLDGKENNEEADEPGGLMIGLNEDVGSPPPTDVVDTDILKREKKRKGSREKGNK